MNIISTIEGHGFNGETCYLVTASRNNELYEWSVLVPSDGSADIISVANFDCRKSAVVKNSNTTKQATEPTKSGNRQFNTTKPNQKSERIAS